MMVFPNSSHSHKAVTILLKPVYYNLLFNLLIPDVFYKIDYILIDGYDVPFF